MVWFFLVAAVFFILGGLLSVQPSRTQKRIARLREDAMAKGLHVKLPVSLKFPKGFARSESPYYCRNLSDRRLSHQFAHVLRTENAALNSSGRDHSLCESIFYRELQKLPSDFVAIYLGAGLIGVSWSEARAAEVPEVLIACLSELELQLQSNL